MTRIYIAGPMTGLPEFNYPAFHDAAAHLRALGYDVVSPAEINAELAHEGWLPCMRRDIAGLVRCDGIALLPGWNRSRGAQIEATLAISLGLHCASVETWLSGAMLHPARPAAVPA